MDDYQTIGIDTIFYQPGFIGRFVTIKSHLFKHDYPKRGSVCAYGQMPVRSYASDTYQSVPCVIIATEQGIEAIPLLEESNRITVEWSD